MSDKAVFRFELGQVLHAMDGWQEPLITLSVINRKRAIASTGTGYQYINYYMLMDGSVYTEDQLKDSANGR